MLRGDLRGQSYELVSSLDAPPKTPKPAYVAANESSFSQDQLPPRNFGKPGPKRLLNTADCIAVLLSLTCLALAVCAISPSLSYAARLEYTRQIIVLGFLLGVMNQCLQRVTPPMFLLIEARFGSSSLQNFDGLLRWAPLAEEFSLIWRTILVLLLLLPLGLGVVYKRFTGGMGVLNISNNGTLYTPTIPYGLDNIGPLTAIANATGPFMASSLNETAFDFAKPQPFGYNIILLSNTSAATVDGPEPLYIQQLQHELEPEVVFNLSARVRGTVATYNATAETHRDDQSFWSKYFDIMYLQSTSLLYQNKEANRIGLLNLLSASNNGREYYDASWAFLGLYNGSGEDIPDRPAFEQTALGFDVRRHHCDVTWEITRNSMELVSGTCDPNPMEWQYQYLENCQFFLDGSYFLPILGEYLVPFAGARNQSHWRLPTFAVVTATVFWSRVALGNGYVAVQVNGPLWKYWYMNPAMPQQPGAKEWAWNETYPLNHTILKQVPTLEPAGTLYLVLVIQPFFTIVAFVAALLMYETPIGRGFGMISVLAGVDKDSLEQLSGATFSGKVSKPISLRIRVKSEDVTHEHSVHRLEYVVGEKGNTGSVSFGVSYH